MAELMNTAEAADHLGLSPGYLGNLRCWKRGPRWRRIGAREVRYDIVDLDKWRDRRRADRREP